MTSVSVPDTECRCLLPLRKALLLGEKTQVDWIVLGVSVDNVCPTGGVDVTSVDVPDTECRRVLPLRKTLLYERKLRLSWIVLGSVLTMFVLLVVST